MSNYVKRACEILSKEGPVGLTKSAHNHMYKLSHSYYTKLVAQSDLYWVYKKKKIINQTVNESDADPFKILWVDPNKIEYLTGELKYSPSPNHLQYFYPSFHRINSCGSVKNGNWDTHSDGFTELWEFKGIKQWYIKDTMWEKTDFFKKHMEVINEGNQAYGSNTREELLNRLHRYENMLKEIKRDGYKTQRQQSKLKPLDEIGVNIGRDGTLLFNGGGRHRLSIAKVLNLDEVPINVKVRHTLWQKIRDDVRQNGFDMEHEEIRNHPDLQDV